jgi:hypothetical protein
VDETDQIRKVMEKMEAELNEAGALNLDPTPSKLAVLKGKVSREKEVDRKEHQDWEDESDDEDASTSISTLLKIFLKVSRVKLAWLDPEVTF